MAQDINYIRQWLESIRDERATHANTATRIGTAFLMILNYILDSDTPYLRKDQEDSTRYLLRLLAGAVIGESGQIRLNPDGSIICSKIHVNGSAIFDEVVFNHQNVLEGDTFFTDKGIIEDVEYLQGNQLQITLRKEHDNDVITFHQYDCLRCSMNNLDTQRTFKTSWFLVDSVDTSTNSMIVTLYDNEDVPGGSNYAPMTRANIIRWGNPVDTSRQQLFFVSSQDGRFLFLQGVTQPIITESNYSAFLGLPPNLDILSGLHLNSNQPYIFARGLIVQDIIKINYQGNPQYTARDCGIWSSTHQYINGYDEQERGYFSDRVWWGGCLWKAAVSLPTLGREPRYNNADWVCLLGGANTYIEITSEAGDAFPAGQAWSTRLIADVYNGEMKLTEEEIGRSRITWQRISEDTEGDIAWNIIHATGTTGLILSISSTADFPGEWTAQAKVSFQCDIYIPELREEPYSQEYSITM